MGEYGYSSNCSNLPYGSPRCPNLRTKNRGLFKCDYSCSATGKSLDKEFCHSVCTYYKSQGPKVTIKFDECRTFKMYGVQNSN